jgi:hypothetical protein
VTRKYHFSAELLGELQAAYCGDKRELSAALDRLEARTGWPRHAFKYEAGRRGWLRNEGRRPWLPDEVEYLRLHLGEYSAARIAKTLGRSTESVIAKAEAMRLSRRLTEGYTITDLAQVFGVDPHKAASWVRRGLLGRIGPNMNEARVTDKAVAAFIRNHFREYDLRRVDQVWFKSMVFAPLAGWQV